tara:strand:+ start:3370 stop:4185 length:816 start_codon:yes stop_codon:yes gene_type:complete
MATRYTVYFAGQILAGHTAEEVRSNLAKLFKADEATLDKLFSGSTQILKRDCDEATAAKYQQAMARAGAQAIVKSAQPEAPAPTAPAAPKGQTAAEKIAALAAAEDDTRFSGRPPPAPIPEPEEDGKFQLAPVGSDLLRPEERRPVEALTPDISALSVDAAATRLSAEPTAPPPPPDTAHIELDTTAGLIPTLAEAEPPPPPDTSLIDLSPAGTDFSDCAGEEPIPPTLDLSELEVAPEGSVVLEERFRRRETADAPSTDHIVLADHNADD